MEQLEPRLMLNGHMPLLPGLEVSGTTIDDVQGQIIHLDFDGAQDVDYDGPVTVENIDVPAFAAPGDLAGREPAIIADVLARLETTFADTGVTFVTEEPEAGTPHSAIYIGGTDAPFADHGSFLGLAETVDAGNTVRDDDAFVFSGKLTYGMQQNQIAQVLSDVIGHEIGHLIGYGHTGSTSALSLRSVAAQQEVLVSDKATYVYQGYPDNRYVGSDYVKVGSNGDDNYISYVEFDLGDLSPDIDLASAYLKLKVAGSTGSALNVSVYEASDPWTESGSGNPTFNSKPGGYADPSVTYYVSTSETWKSWRVDDLVQDWLDGTRSNYGFRLQANEWNVGDRIEFWSDNAPDTNNYPRLEINYFEEFTVTGVDCDIDPETSEGNVEQGDTVSGDGTIAGTGNGTVVYEWIWRNPDSSWGGSGKLTTTMSDGTAIVPEYDEFPTDGVGEYRASVRVTSPSTIESSYDTYTVEEGPATVIITAHDNSAGEPADDGTFRISRTGSTASSLTVNFTVGSGNPTDDAERGTDYVLKKGSTTLSGNSVTIDANQTYVDVTVEVKDDSSTETAESVVLSLAGGSGYQVGNDDSATISISDDDTVVSPSHEVLEYLAKQVAYNPDLLSTQSYGYQLNHQFGDPDGTGFYAMGLFDAPGGETLEPVLVFRGTDDMADWLANVDTDGIGYSQFEEWKWVEGGYGLYDWLDEQVEPVNVIGHSLGGALAQWVAVEYEHVGSGEIDEVVTFNSPGIDRAYIEMMYFEEAGDEKVTHYIAEGDFVSMFGEAFLPGTYTLVQH